MKRNKETGIFELDNNEEKFEGVVCKIGKVSQDGLCTFDLFLGHYCSQKEGKYDLQPYFNFRYSEGMKSMQDILKALWITGWKS